MAGKKEKHTTYSIGPLSYPRMRELLDGTWQSGGAGREALREELREILLHSEAIEGYTSRLLLPEYEDTDLACVYPLSYDEVVYTNHLGAVPAIVRRNLVTGEDVWRVTGYTQPAGIDYDDENDRLLVGYYGGILVLRGSTGEVLQNITRFTDPANIERTITSVVYEAVWDPEDLSYIYFVAIGVNVAVHLNIDTLVADSVFGEWGVAGTDMSHLNAPRSIEVNPPDDNVFIADEYNHRVLRLDLDLSTVKDQLLIQRPRSVRKARWGVTTQQRYPTLFSSGDGGTDKYVWTFCDNRGRHLLFSLPFNMEWPRWTPDFQRFWGCQIFGMEVDVRRVMGRFISKSDCLTLLNKTSVPDAGWTSAPIAGLILGDISITLYSDQAGTMHVQVPDENSYVGYGLWVPTTFSWITWDSQSFSANTMMIYNPTRIPPLFRLFVDPDAAATITMRLNIYPRNM